MSMPIKADVIITRTLLNFKKKITAKLKIKIKKPQIFFTDLRQNCQTAFVRSAATATFIPVSAF